MERDPGDTVPESVLANVILSDWGSRFQEKCDGPILLGQGPGDKGWDAKHISHNFMLTEGVRHWKHWEC